MLPSACRPKILGFLLRALLLAAPALPAGAEQQPFYCFGVGDGLADSRVEALFASPSGFLWIGTSEGLSRFDGEHFTTYGRAEGLARPEIRQIAEAPDGSLWLGGAGGLVRMAGAADFALGRRFARFETIAVESERPDAPVDGLLFDPRRGELWVSTLRGLFRARLAAHPQFSLVLARPFGDPPWSSFLLGEDGRIFVAAGNELLELADGGLERHPAPPGETIVALARAAAGGPGELLVASQDAVYLRRQAGYRKVLESGGKKIQALLLGADQRLEIATSEGLLVAQMDSGDGRYRLERFTRERGLLSDDLLALSLDGDGNTWIGSAGAGVCRWPREELASFGRADGLPDPELDRVREVAGRIFVHQTDGTWFVGADASDASAERLLRFSAGSAPPGEGEGPEAQLDAAGNRYWISPAAGLIRQRPTGDEQTLALGEGLEAAQIADFALDHQGRIWLAVPGYGLASSPDPAAEQPRFERLTSAEGLSSDQIHSLCIDPKDRLYLGSGRGLDLYEPASRKLRHFTTRDGLAGDLVRDLECSPDGQVYIATATGLTRLRSDSSRLDDRAPPIYLTEISRNGEELELPPTGLRRFPGRLDLSAAGHLHVDFVGLDFAPGVVLRYQYRLGQGMAWSRPSLRRALAFAHLPPGTYSLEVRALAGDTPSAEPASLEIHVAPPFWQRREVWLVALGLLVLAFFLRTRTRFAKALTREKIRRQIAADLHDELGSGLVQIAIRGEVGRRGNAEQASLVLGEIADLARELRQSMSDIVWALDPRRDNLESLFARWHRVAIDLLEAGGTQVEMHAPPAAEIATATLDPDLRRHLFLFGKEALTNIARHAAAERVDISVRLTGRRLELEIADDGRGFDLAEKATGHGLETLRQRAAALRGRLELQSKPGQGTRVRLEAPLDAPPFWARRPGKERP